MLLFFAFFFAIAPSRAPEQGCKWEQLSVKNLGLDAWVQRCDFSFRKIDFFAKGHSLFIRYSDGGAPEAVIDVFELKAGETAEAGLKRIFAEHTPKKIASTCKLAAFREDAPRKDVQRFTFVPKVPPKSDPDEVGDPQCGELGDSPDGIQYFEVQPGARKVLFVRVGQDVPLFDEQTLTLAH